MGINSQQEYDLDVAAVAKYDSLLSTKSAPVYTCVVLVISWLWGEVECFPFVSMLCQVIRHVG